MYTYIEIKSFTDGKPVKRLDVSSASDDDLYWYEIGANGVLDHLQHYTHINKSKVELPELDGILYPEG